MNSERKAIDVNLITEEVIDIEEFISEYKKNLEDRGILHKEGMQKKSDGKFDSDLWIVYIESTHTFAYFEFNEFENMKKFKMISKEDITIIKCWLAGYLIEGYAPSRVQGKFRNIETFIKMTKNFDLELVSGTKGDGVSTFIDIDEPGSGDRANAIIDYIDFLESIGRIEIGHEKALSLALNISKSIDKKTKARKLPKNKDIFSFDIYIKKFFEEDIEVVSEADKILRKIYKPVFIWWKITNVIPMRSSEIASKIPRDCLLIENGRYFLKINRVKVSRETRKVEVGTVHIPLLNKLEITKEIHDLIYEYIENTKFDECSKSLFSFVALMEFKDKYMKLKEKGLEEPFFTTGTKKYKEDTFSRRILGNLLNSFYEQIIKKKYKDEFIETRLKIGDTRHLAFSSLVLQGISPIEIAMLGGHTSLRTQDHYVGHARYYIDSEILDFVSGRKLNVEISYESLADKIINNTTWKPPRPLSECNPTEDGVGYCTLDIKKDDTFCDDVPCCPYCSKWWCEPTNESFIKIRKFIEESEISPINRAIEEEEQFLVRLMEEAKVININGLLEIEKTHDEKIRETALKIRSSADKIIFFRKSLLELSNKNKLYI